MVRPHGERHQRHRLSAEGRQALHRSRCVLHHSTGGFHGFRHPQLRQVRNGERLWQAITAAGKFEKTLDEARTKIDNLGYKEVLKVDQQNAKDLIRARKDIVKQAK